MPRLASLLLPCCAALCLGAQPVGAAPARRLGLFIASVDGGPGTTPLGTAREDAARVREALQDLAGLAPADGLLLVDPTPDAVLLALGELESRARETVASGREAELWLWCGAHVRGGELRLGPATLPLATLEALLQTSPASRRLAVFDLSESRVGASAKEPPRLRLETRGVPGLALLVAEAPSEAAWASALAGSSHVAFHVANGLRGAADENGDAQVSASELLGWVARRAGRELAPLPEPWPTLTALGDAGLVLDAAVEAGHYVVADEQGRVAGELEKGPGAARLVLPAGRYGVKRKQGERLRLATFQLEAGAPVVLREADLVDAPASRDPVRRADGASFVGRHWSVAVSGHALLFSDPVLPGAPAIGAELTLHQLLLGGVAVSLDGSYGWASGQLSAPLVPALAWSSTIAAIGLSALYEWNQASRIVPFAGVRVGLLGLTRGFVDPTFATQSAWVVTPGAFAGLRVRLGLGLSLGARVRLDYVGVNIDGARSLAATDASALLDYEFGG